MLKRGGGQGVPSTNRLVPFLLPLLFTIVTVAIGAVTWRFHVAQTEVSERALDAQLTTKADAKVVNWSRPASSRRPRWST